ncbi:hypothetical protein [Aquibacillus sediminis]|uniref:hypothetical protein n=1 Tax=Aquibacillus sediminis TaxID=2574734 RepID=UPI0011085445|nr:hypothetical protein [Aquibacillus sediminis]
MEKEENDRVTNEGKKMFATIVDYLLAIFIGYVLGFIVAKVYQTWAIVYRESQYDLNRPTQWETESPPAWAFATESPNSFFALVVLFFIFICILFTFCLRKRLKTNAK